MAEVQKQPYVTVEGGLPGEDPRDKFRYLNILTYADYGVGKTTFAASACDDPRTSPQLVLDFEGGAPLRYLDKDPKTYTIRTIRSIKDLNAYYDYLRKGNHPYKSVSLDSMTEIQKLGLYEFVYGPGMTYEDMFKGNMLEIKTAEIQHWGKSGTQMAMIIRAFRDLPMHVFFTCLSQTMKDEVTGLITTTVALPGKQADEIPGIPDIVGYMEMERPKPGTNDAPRRIMRVQPNGKVKAKDRTHALGAGLYDPTVTKMLDLIYDHYKIS